MGTIGVHGASSEIAVAEPVTVDATDLDIRNLSQTQDAVLVYGSDDGGTTKRVVKTDSGGAVQVDIESAPTITVQATDLDIRDLVFATDKVDASGTVLGVGDNNIGNVDIERSIGAVSTANSSTATLGNGATFTGTGEEVKNYSTISVNIFADENSATDGVSLEWSSDNTNWDIVETLTYAADIGRSISVNPRARYFRIRYTNGTTPQGAFRLQTIYHPHQLTPITRTLDKNVSENASAVIVRAILAAQRAGGSDDYLNIQATNGGNLKVAVEEVNDTVDVSGSTLGANSGVDIGDVTINNAAGASAVNIQDGGNSITVDGSVTVSGSVTADTELPAAAALADDTVNPTAPAVGSFDHVWDGATWDRTPGNSTDGVTVNLGTNNDVTVTGTVAVSSVGGTVAVTQSGTWDEVGINDSGNSITVDNAALSVVGGGTEATALRVTVANDSTGVLSVDDNSGSLTVDNGGTFVVQENGAALTSLQLIDDTIATLGTTTYSEDTTKGAIIGALRRDADTTAVNTTNEIAPLQVGPSGWLKARHGVQASPATTWATTHEPSANTQATITKAAGSGGQRHICTGLTVTLATGSSAPAAVQVAARLRDGTSGAGTILWAGVFSLPATAGISTGATRSGLWIVGSADTAMTLEFSAAAGANTIEAVSLEGVTLIE